MNPDQQLLLIESIIANPAPHPETKLDLIRGYLKECRAKQVGKIIVDHIEKAQNKKSTVGFEGDVFVSATPKKRGRGRPKKKTIHQQNMIKKFKEEEKYE